MGMALRWLGALVAMTVVAVVSVNLAIGQIQGVLEFGDSAAAPAVPTDVPTLDPLAGPVADGSAGPSRDFALLGGAVAGTEAELLVFEGAGEAAMALTFPLISGDPACLSQAVLEITLLEATPAQLGVYPANVGDTAELEDGADAPDPLARTAEPMALAVTDGSPGRLQWDVTDLYRQWVAAGEFLGGGEAVPEGTPLTVLVMPTEDPTTRRKLVLAASESGAAGDGGGPLLRWTGLPSCGTGVAPGGADDGMDAAPGATTTEPTDAAPEI